MIHPHHQHDVHLHTLRLDSFLLFSIFFSFNPQMIHLPMLILQKLQPQGTACCRWTWPPLPSSSTISAACAHCFTSPKLKHHEMLEVVSAWRGGVGIRLKGAPTLFSGQLCIFIEYFRQ